MARVAFIGLGVMGHPMAGHLETAGHDVTVYNRTAPKADAWVAAHGGRAETSPRRAAEGCDLAFTCVGNDEDLRAVALGGDGVLAGLSPGSVMVDHTTASATVARELAVVARDRGVGFVDAPVSGGQAGAVSGQLAVMCGGSEDDFARAAPVIDAYAKAIVRFGNVGAGQLTKMVNQICIAGLLQGLSEALNFAERAELDARAVTKLISQGAAGSWQLTNRSETMIDGKFDFGFAVDWMRKDLKIALAQADEIGVSLPVTALVDQFYGEVQSIGGHRWDTSSLITRLRLLDAQKARK